MSQPKVSFIITTYNTEKWIPQVVASIREQDWSNKEIIIVDDGSQDGSLSVAKSFEGKKDTKVIEKTHSGAPQTRNRGFQEATGDYILFLDTDSKLKPGTIRKQVEFLESHREYGFYYGGYVICSDEELEKPVMEFRSDPFDRYFLEQFNYISGTSLMRKECFEYAVEKQGGWDPNIQSLQDWDLWLTITKKYKGYHDQEILFATYLPGSSGISKDSASHWLKRLRAIKKKHELKENDICVTSLGAPEHARKIAKLIGADYRLMPSQKPHNYKMIYLLGFYPQAIDNHAAVFRNHNGVRLIHWIGTDILQLMTLPYWTALQVKKVLDDSFPHQLSEVEMTHDELKKMQIETEIVPLPVALDISEQPLPKEYAVAIYRPETNRQVHSVEVIDQIMHSMPDVKFKVFGTPQEIGEQNNVEFLGKLDEEGMKKLIKKTSLLLRLTVHDGLPLTACEWILAGRHVLTNHTFPYCEKTNGEVADVIDKIRRMKDLRENTIGASYYRDWLDIDNYKEKIHGYLKRKR